MLATEIQITSFVSYISQTEANQCKSPNVQFPELCSFFFLYLVTNFWLIVAITWIFNLKKKRGKKMYERKQKNWSNPFDWKITINWFTFNEWPDEYLCIQCWSVFMCCGIRWFYPFLLFLLLLLLLLHGVRILQSAMHRYHVLIRIYRFRTTASVKLCFTTP